LRSSTTLAKKLRQHAEYLKQNPKTVVTLVGYVDDAGSRSYNLAITEQRILAVKQLLRTYGTPQADSSQQR
jgi:outer membrane protein OmpA-like peptidoglycan-associated protein